MDFSSLGLSTKVIDAIHIAGYSTPTAIQAQAIPAVLQRKDVLGLAQTGSGKTAAFVLPMLTLLEKGRARARMPRTLILEPTRELAAQVHEAFETLGNNHKLNVALLIGGVSFDEQTTKIDRGADVVIATPGRLLDHFGRGKLLLTGVEMLVIDEADRMLDMGFMPDIERIWKLLPFTRQTLFFSATMPPEIKRITAQFLHNPEIIAVTPASSTSDTIAQYIINVPHDAKQKRTMLRDLLLNQSSVQNGIVFANRKTTVITLEASIKKHGFSVAALHGNMSQSARLATLASFRANEVTYLVASDVAARGLDIPEVSHVFNYDVPTHSEDYVHRIGRTGRAGRNGHAFMLVTPEDSKNLKAIEKLIGKPIEHYTGLNIALAPAEPALKDAKKTDVAPRKRRRSTAKPTAKPQKTASPEAEIPPIETQQKKEAPKEDAAEDHGFHAGNMPAFLLAKPRR